MHSKTGWGASLQTTEMPKPGPLIALHQRYLECMNAVGAGVGTGLYRPSAASCPDGHLRAPALHYWNGELDFLFGKVLSSCPWGQLREPSEEEGRWQSGTG